MIRIACFQRNKEGIPDFANRYMNHILLLLLLLITCTVRGQTDSTHQLREVEVVDYRQLSASTTARTVVADTSAASRMTAQSIGDLLAGESAVFVKDNGKGRMSTLSIRGTSAVQNTVSWNGLDINTPAIGLSDVSLLPVFFADDVLIQSGGNGPLNGSQAMGGVLSIISKPVFDQGMHVTFFSSAARYDDYSQGMKTVFSNRNYYSRTAIYNRTALNNYPFKDIYIAGAPERTLQHAAFAIRSLMNEQAYLAGHHLFSVHLMQTDARHELPVQMGSYSTAGSEKQFDTQLKIAASWKYEFKKLRAGFNAGYLNDALRYTDEVTETDSKTRGESYQANGDFIYTAGAHVLQAGASFNHFSARVISMMADVRQGYGSTGADDRSAVYINYRYSLADKITTTVALRHQWSGNSTGVTVPSAGVQFNLSKAVALFANGGAVYRLPTMNDLYWQPGGNPLLKPEKGSQYDGRVEYRHHKRQHATFASAGMFYMLIHDRIQWIPGFNGIYRPVNMPGVSSRGLELQGEQGYSSGHWYFTFHGGLQYIKAYSDDFKTENNSTQLVYIPALSWSIRTSVKYRNTAVLWSSGYTGYRYITEDNSAFLNPYSVMSVTLMQDVKWKNNLLSIAVMAGNLLNEHYEVIALHPMEGRSFRISVQWNSNWGKKGNVKKSD